MRSVEIGRSSLDRTRAALAVTALASSILASGCVDRDPEMPHDMRWELDARGAPLPPRAPRGPAETTVAVRCDGDGSLHMRAPDHARVTRPDAADDGGEIEIAYEPPPPPPRRPLRTTKSLGFIGDGKLTSSPSRGGPWNAPDGLLPPHAHGGSRPFGRWGSRY